MEKITGIVEVSFSKDGNGYSEYEGYQITTDKQTIKMGIDNGQCCCENWGYLMSEDDINEFIGSELIKVEITDTQLKPVEEYNDNDTYEGSAMFVNFTTTNGVLQFVAYNEHNGYYGHEAVLMSSQLNHAETL